jgi:ATP-binding cassette, subfamily C (CFTR/MRP), member 10
VRVENQFIGESDDIPNEDESMPQTVFTNPRFTENVAAEWPHRGVVRFDDVRMRYRADLPLALNGTSFETRAGEKLGIVGRTGSGKSSLFLTLFGVLGLESGHILVDEIDISKVPLHVLRSRLAIIPQDAFLISASVYENLVCASDCDLQQPLSETELSAPASTRPSMNEVEDRLRELGLYDAMQALGGLETRVGELGGSLSVGQRQLVCLVRALLRRARVICIDEATASIDEHNEALLHAAMRNSLRDCTALVIAHRLRTVVEFCDRVVVMRNGAPIEIGEPRALLADSASHFHTLYHGRENLD